MAETALNKPVRSWRSEMVDAEIKVILAEADKRERYGWLVPLVYFALAIIAGLSLR